MHSMLSFPRLLLLACALATTMVIAADGNLTFKSSEQETQYHRLIEEFRCPKCQNANLAGSDAPIAQDLKQKTYELVQNGRTDQEIRDFMVTRYGEFISYKPPIKPSTWLLWFTPPMLLALGLMGWLLRARQRQGVSTAPLSSEESWRLKQLLDGSSVNPQTPQQNDQEQPHGR
nr:cytochrome c-type biogenesis protein [Aquirhabdus parva]